MILNQKELTIQRALTEMFILSDSDSVVLQPNKREPNGSGGFVVSAQPPRSPQVLRLIPLSNLIFERNTLDGATATPQFMLMGKHTAHMAKGDRFTLNGKRYEVVHIQEDSEYQKKGETVLLGDA